MATLKDSSLTLGGSLANDSEEPRAKRRRLSRESSLDHGHALKHPVINDYSFNPDTIEPWRLGFTGSPPSPPPSITTVNKSSNRVHDSTQKQQYSHGHHYRLPPTPEETVDSEDRQTPTDDEYCQTIARARALLYENCGKPTSVNDGGNTRMPYEEYRQTNVRTTVRLYQNSTQVLGPPDSSSAYGGRRDDLGGCSAQSLTTTESTTRGDEEKVPRSPIKGNAENFARPSLTSIPFSSFYGIGFATTMEEAEVLKPLFSTPELKLSLSTLLIPHCMTGQRLQKRKSYCMAHGGLGDYQRHQEKTYGGIAIRFYSDDNKDRD